MLIFVHIEKTAGTSLKYIFRNNFGFRHCDSLKNKKKIFTQDDLNYAKKVFGDIKCITGHNLVEPTKNLKGDHLNFLTFLRDPVLRLASFYQDSLKLLRVVSPEKLNMKYMKKLIAQDNSIKNNLIKNPKTLQILNDVNKLDIELYNYVKNDLFPKRIKEHQNKINEVKLPESHYKSHFTFNYQLSIAFNKYIYRQLLKLRKS